MSPATRQTPSAKSSTNTIQFHRAKHDPDEFGPSRPDNVIATPIKCVAAPFHFPGSESGKYSLYVLGTLRTEDGDEFVEPWLFGWFGENDPKKVGRNWYPSKDGDTIAVPPGLDLEQAMEEYALLAAGNGAKIQQGEEEFYEGVYTISPGTGKPPRKDWQQVLDRISQLEAFDPARNPDAKPFPFKDNERTDIIVGHTFEWVRVERTNKSKKDTGDFPVLVPVNYFGYEVMEELGLTATTKSNGGVVETKSSQKKAVKSAAKTTPAPVDEVDEEEISDTDDTGSNFADIVEEQVSAFLSSSDSPVPGRQIPPSFLQAFEDPKEQNQAVNIWNNIKWRTSPDRPWVYKAGNYSMKEE